MKRKQLCRIAIISNTQLAAWIRREVIVPESDYFDQYTVDDVIRASVLSVISDADLPLAAPLTLPIPAQLGPYLADQAVRLHHEGSRGSCVALVTKVAGRLQVYVGPADKAPPVASWWRFEIDLAGLVRHVEEQVALVENPPRTVTAGLRALGQ